MFQRILTRAVAALTVPLLVSTLQALPAQTPTLEFPQASPASTLKQRFGLTDVEIEYSRPSARGRKIFGGLVPFGEVWRTGANNATKLTFSSDVKLEGANVPAGSYALFTIPGETEWTIILSKVTGTWGSYQYNQKDDLTRVKVRPTTLAESVETMSIDLADLRTDAATLTLSWEKTRVSIQLKNDIVNVLKPKIEAAMAADGKKPYFQAAMFYYANDLDLKQALTWMDAALAEQPDAVWMVYRKGLIQAKVGDKAGATTSAQKALDIASKTEGPLGAEYKRLSQELLASLR